MEQVKDLEREVETVVGAIRSKETKETIEDKTKKIVELLGLHGTLKLEYLDDGIIYVGCLINYYFSDGHKFERLISSNYCTQEDLGWVLDGVYEALTLNNDGEVINAIRKSLKEKPLVTFEARENKISGKLIGEILNRPEKII